MISELSEKCYNEEFKYQYLEDNASRNKYMKSNVLLLFRRIAIWEERFQKDLYDFSVEEILGVYKYLSMTSLESLMVANNQYKLYAAYALERGVIKDNQNHFDEIDLPTLKTCLYVGLAEEKLITREELLDILNSSSVENVSDKVIALGLFEGLCGKELTELTQLRPEDINPKTNVVKLFGGRKLTISDKLKDWCLESADEYTYYNSLNKLGNKKYLTSDDRVLKRLSNSTVDSVHQRHKTVNRRLDHLIDITGRSAFGVGSLKESGRLEMIKDLRKTGLSLDDALKDKDMQYRYGRIPSRKRYALKYGLN